MNRKMKEMPLSLRPYERCKRDGAGSLNDSELLAIILRNGSAGCNSLQLAEEIIAKGGHSLLSLLTLSEKELLEIRGIGEVKAIQLKCIAELSRRLAKTQRRQMLRLNSPDSIAAYYMEDLRHERTEQMIAAFFDTKCGLIKDKTISSGTVSSTLVSPREIFLDALEANAVSLVLLHNHPSGDPTPSMEDIYVTKRVYECGRLLGIELLDHIIIGNNTYKSFRKHKIIDGLFEQSDEGSNIT
jgi:DNA repair protein RadC